jgi:sugar fermentation stimulation protein A
VGSSKKEHRTVSLFRNDLEAVFVRRPNRFLIIANAEGREIPCHCPNPGRLIEFFGFRDSTIPGIRLILERRPPSSTAKTAYTVVALRYRGGIVPFFSARANRAAEALFLPELIPGLREVYPEYTLGNSRFDFLCIDGRGRRHLVEVKACSLIEYGTAMFPDAPSGRALKHLEELAALSAQGYHCHVLFVIVHGKPEVFIPNLHTDPLFAAALGKYGHAGPPDPLFAAALGKYGHAGPPDPLFAAALSKYGHTAGSAPGPGGPVAIHAGLLRCGPKGNAALAAPSIPVDLSHGELAAGDGGNYLVILELPEPRQAEIGALGNLAFRAGWYVYAGSARKNLSKRISRHLRKTGKRKHWHLDYLCPLAKTIKALPVYSYRNLECDLAAALAALGGRGIPGFGCSDCRCKSHLYYFKTRPQENRDFVDMLFRFRHREGLIRESPGNGHTGGQDNAD